MIDVKKTLRFVGGISSIVLNAIMSYWSFFLLIGVTLVALMGWEMGFNSSPAGVFELLILSIVLLLLATVFVLPVFSVIISSMLCADKGAKGMAVTLIVTNTCSAIFGFTMLRHFPVVWAVSALSLLTAGVMMAFLCIKDSSVQSGTKIPG